MRIHLLCGVCAATLLSAHPMVAAAQEAENTIVVSGQRAQQAHSIQERRAGLGIVDVASSNELGQLPDRNIAEVVERLPGVGVQYDQGEGRYVAIRGIPSNLNGYTLNGFEIGNPDGGTRALPLDIVSGQLLSSVEVFKVRTPDQTGQGIGGVINLNSQTAFDFREPFIIAANAQVGYQELRKGSQPVKGDLTIGGRFGQDNEIGILLGASYSDRTFTSYGIYPDDWAPDDGVARGAVPANVKYTDYRLNRERIGFTGSLDWHGEYTQLYLRGFYSQFAEDEYRQRFRLDFSDVVFDDNGLTGISTDTEQRSDLRLEQKDKSIMSVMAGGESRIDLWTLEYGVAYTRNEVKEPNQSWQFRGNPGDVAVDFTDRLYSAEPVDGYLAPADLGFRSASFQDENGVEDNLQGRLDLTRQLDGMGGDSFLRLGTNIRNTEKRFDSENTAYGRGPEPDRFTLEGLAGENVWAYPERDHGYLVAPTIDADLIQAFTADNLPGPMFVLDEEGTLQNAVLNDFDLMETVFAGYAMANLDFGSLAITAGARVEHTQLDVTGYQLESGDSGAASVIRASMSNEYTDILPTIVARLEPSNETLIRLAYSRSVGRPAYNQLSPGGSVSYELVSTGHYEGEVSYGNPQLKPYVADSFDAAFEWYFAPGGALTIGGFAKLIDNPVFTQVDVLTDTVFNGRAYDRFEISQPQNADSGELLGLELGYRHQFDFLPGLLSGFGVNANVTLIDGSLQVPGRDEKMNFPEQSELLWGAQLFYQKGPVEASVAYHHNGKALIGISDDDLTDQYNDDYRRLDAKIAFDITDNIRIFAEGQNLTDEPTRQYQGGRTDWLIQQERYGRTFWAGFSARW